MTAQQAPAPPFSSSVVAYAHAGWPCILPVPPGAKHPPPIGYTGADGIDTDPVTLATWAAGDFAAFSVALRLPDGVIGIDVDQYEKKGVQKNGAATLGVHEQTWGPLPLTWTSTARGSGQPSRIHFYRVPPGRYATGLVGGDVDIIQRHHRYVVVEPSINPETGASYAWYDPNGSPTTPSGRVPSPAEFAELPAAWVAGLAEGATAQSLPASDPASGWAMLEQLRDDTRVACVDVTEAHRHALDLVNRAEAGSRHDTMTARVHHLVQLGAQGHPGVGHALLELSIAWDAVTAGEGRGKEFNDMLTTSARKAVTLVGAHQVVRDPCLSNEAFVVPGAAPEDADGTPMEAIEPHRWWSVREVIGAHAFDPIAQLDQPLAQAVLERTYPVTRFAYDSGGWLLRVPGRWELHGDLTSWAVAQVASLLPIGDPTAEKGSDEHARSARRARFNTQAGSRAIAGKMGALVAGGTHPCAIKLADLDSDPEILWSGGVAWSLRHSRTELVAAAIDPATPHLHSAGVTPVLADTPLWDAFLAAVWPDPEIRAWAIRVLSISLTGYADRALPILLGETGRGKTQVISLVMSVLGSYAHAADARLLSPAGERAHASIVFALKGRRLSFIDEGPREGRMAQERLKQLSGGGALTANAMNQNPVTWIPTHTLVLTTNDEPPLSDPAVRSRARLIPCDGDPELVRITRAAIGHTHSAAWRAEAPGVLAKLMLEAGAWLDDPTTALTAAAPESIRYLAEHVGAEQDPVMVWLTEETEYYETGTASRELYGAFVASCRRNNLRADAIPTETKWGRTLTRLGYGTSRTEQGKKRPLRIRQGGFWPGSPVPPAPTAQIAPSPDPAQLGPNPAQLMHGSNANYAAAKPQVNLPFSEDPAQSAQFNDSPTHTRTGAPAHEAPMQNGSQPCILSDENAEKGSLTSGNADAGLADGCPEGACEYGGPGTAPICTTYCGRQHGAIWASIPDELGWIERNAINDQRRQDELTPLADLGTATGPKPPKKRAPANPEKAAAAKEKRDAAVAEKRSAAIAEAAGGRMQLPVVLSRAGDLNEVELAAADTLLALITDDHALTVDVEHTGYPVGHREFKLRTVQLGNEHYTLILDPHDEDQAACIRRHLERAPGLHAHSATADLIPLSHAGLLDAGLDHAWARMRDTGMAAKLANPGAEAGLKLLAPAVLGAAAVSPAADAARSALFKAGKWLTDTEADTPIERSGWAQVDSSSPTMLRYAGSDVLDCAAVAARLPWPEGEQLEREQLAQRVTARIADRGLRIDGEQVAELQAQQRAELNRWGEVLTGYGATNPGSDQQVAAVAERLGASLPRTATGKPSVAKGVLDQMSLLEGDLGDFVRARLGYQKAKTRLGLILEPYHQLVTNGDGRARPTVYTLGARTGRMSCALPNLQQVPREGGFRACLTADPGHVLISADFASVELRVAAALSRDENLMAIISDPDRDIHHEIARIVWGPNAGKPERYQAKRKVFGRIYGSGLEGLMTADPPVSEPIARSIIDAMDQMMPGLTEWSRMVSEAVKAGHNQFPTYAGRMVHMPTDRPYAAPNYCIQGSARELLIDGLIRWNDTRWGGAVLLPVHDEILTMVPEDEAEEASEALVTAMSGELYGVEIKVEASAPTFAWADAA